MTLEEAKKEAKVTVLKFRDGFAISNPEILEAIKNFAGRENITPMGAIYGFPIYTISEETHACIIMGFNNFNKNKMEEVQYEN